MRFGHHMREINRTRTGGVELGDDADAAVARVLHHLLDVRWPVGVRVGEGAVLGQPRQRVGLVGEALVVHDVPVQHVHLRRRHRLQVVLQVTPAVEAEQEAAFWCKNCGSDMCTMPSVWCSCIGD